MSIRIYGNVDFKLNEAENLVVQKLSTHPAPTDARFYFNTVEHKFYGHNGTEWVDLSSNGWRPAVDTYTDLALMENLEDGLAVYVNDVDRFYTWNDPNQEWISHTNWLRPVDTFDDLATTFTSPEAGDTVVVKDEFSIYSWNGSNWLSPAAYSKGFSSGVTIRYCTTSVGIRVTGGTVEVGGRSLSRDDSYLLPLSDETILDAGTTISPNTWYFVYVCQDEEDASKYIAFISEQYPTKSAEGSTVQPDTSSAKYHPSRPARFRGSFKTNGSSEVIRFVRTGTLNIFVGNVNYILQNGDATTKTAVNCRAYVPITSNLSSTYYQMNTDNRDAFIGDEEGEFFVAQTGSGILQIPVTNDSVYYNVVSPGSISLGIHGYYEEI